MLTSLVNVARCPRLCRIEMGITSDAVTGEVSVGQEAPLAIERGAVFMKAFGEKEHDICILVHLAFDLTKWNFAELQGRHGLPDLKRLPDGLICGLFTNFGCVVLNTEKMRKCRDVN